MDKKLLNRKLYKQIKRMDRQEMEEYLKDVYTEGFKDGAESAEGADFKIKLVEILNKTKGIGPKTFDKIMEAAKEMEE